jgi:hypothetical protein
VNDSIPKINHFFVQTTTGIAGGCLRKTIKRQVNPAALLFNEHAVSNILKRADLSLTTIQSRENT